ncbi:regulatory protein [Pseudarcicella hirudinis]|uniref:Regulatory protein RecX n=1 Tax=Pseudarcicella hirudinis TaxID=1079859 RepID=A0A1I5NPJ6_9BACT|nr:regulatory protein RecX [Pseudarcicella hirudinis]SFP23580.1 regulatory protein [Pseudarcicella hirudinis]
MNKEALKKAANFCAYQERTHHEVKEKLMEVGVYGDDSEEIVVWLIENNYLNEERFAKVFAGSKFRQKHWGRLKIRQELKLRKLSEYCIKAGMAEINDEDYMDTLLKIIDKKAHSLKGENPMMLKQKLVRYALSKGFENDLVWQTVNEILKS